MATRVTEGARRERHEKRESLFSSLAAALVSRVSRLRRSRARALFSLNLKKKRLLAVYFLSSVAADSKDGHGLKLEKVGLTFSSLNTLPTKITKKVLWLLLPNEICFISSS